MESRPWQSRLKHEMFTDDPLHTPPAEPSDSDAVLLALETARALEQQGDLLEAARWLQRAADDAAEDGHDERALVLASAAAKLTTAVEREPMAGAPSASRSPTI